MIPPFPEFKKIELSDCKEVELLTKGFPPYSDFNFVSMWSWDTRGETRVSLLNNNLVVRFNDYLSKEPFYSFIGLNKIENTISVLADYSATTGLGSKLKLIPEEIISQYSNQDFISIPDNDNFDYVYNIADFVSCEGKKYETQRNQVNRFKKQNPNANIEIFTSFEVVREMILLLEQKWKLNKIIQDKTIEFRSESEALRRIFDLKHDNFLTVCVFVDSELVAFCVNELLDSDYAISHFAKADVNYSGIYSFLLHETCIALADKGKNYLNYEQDLGLVYLRNSKSAFRPMTFLRKNIIVKQ